MTSRGNTSKKGDVCLGCWEAWKQYAYDQLPHKNCELCELEGKKRKAHQIVWIDQLEFYYVCDWRNHWDENPYWTGGTNPLPHYCPYGSKRPKNCYFTVKRLKAKYTTPTKEFFEQVDKK